MLLFKKKEKYIHVAALKVAMCETFFYMINKI